MEELEILRITLKSIEEKRGKKSGAYRKQTNKIKLLTFILLLENSEIAGTTISKRDAVEKWILSMPGTAFTELVGKVNSKVEEMEHGLISEQEDGKIFLLAPLVSCPKDKEAKTLLRVPFRVFDYIPNLQ